jgi:hypothetical protein
MITHRRSGHATTVPGGFAHAVRPAAAFGHHRRMNAPAGPAKLLRVAAVAMTLALTTGLTGGWAWAGKQLAPAGAITGTRAGLAAVAVIPGTTQAWAVGEKCPKAPEGCVPGDDLVLRENSSGWSQVPAPSPGGQASLVAVSADSASDAWAVGSFDGGEKNLYLHWTGSAWKQVPGPDNSTLTGVAALSPTDALAVGYTTSPSGATVTLALHWNGTTWTRTATPNPGGAGDDQLFGVTGVSASAAWAVGSSLDPASTIKTLILRWNGSSWSQASAPAVTTLTTRLSGVAAGSASDVWAVGQYDSAADFNHPLILHWNGSTWAQEKLPSPGSNTQTLDGVAATASTAWAVGLGPCIGQSVNCPSKTLTMHLTGSGWQVVPSVSVSDAQDQNSLAGVAIAAGSTAWAVGDYFPAAQGEPVYAMLQHWNGSAWSAR